MRFAGAASWRVGPGEVVAVVIASEVFTMNQGSSFSGSPSPVDSLQSRLRSGPCGRPIPSSEPAFCNSRMAEKGCPPRSSEKARPRLPQGLHDMAQGFDVTIRNLRIGSNPFEWDGVGVTHAHF